MIEVQSVVEKIWGPNKGKQSLYLSLPDSIFEQFYGGQAGGGKSEALLMRPILRQWINEPRFQGIILRRTFRELEESLIERSLRGGMLADGSILPSFCDFGGEYNKGNHKWRFKSGATLTFGHAEEESDIRKYDTAEYQYCAFDELTSFTEFQYKFMAFSRVRSTIAGVPALVCSASNPGNIGHRWVRERFVEPCRGGGKILAERIKFKIVNVEEEKITKRIFISASLADNPRLMENDPMYRVRMEMLPEAEKRAKAYGDWWTFSGQVFSEWRTEPFIGEPYNACHVIPPQIPDERLPRVLAIDWGYTAMTFALWGVKLPNKQAIIYREYTPNPTSDKDKEEFGELDSKTVESWTTHIANICLTEGCNPYIVLDPSAWQNRGTGTIADQFTKTWREVTGYSPRLEKADNDRLGGKLLIHDYLRWKPRPKYNTLPQEEFNRERADWLLRNKGLQSYQSYLSQYSPQNETIEECLPKLRITSDCKILIRTIPICVYNERSERNNEDVKEFKGDDPYDDLRYILKKLELININDLPQIQTQDLKSEKEINNFYRKMEILEANKKQKKQIFISRGNSRRRGMSSYVN